MARGGLPLGALALVVALCAGGHRTLAVSPTLGVVPGEIPLYEGIQEFACKDGSQKIPVAAVNDDYCDCDDGSDEPGTSACSNGRFFCANKGHESRLIYSSRINDGVCDCCDGTDEYSGRVTCTDRCEEQGAERRADLAKFMELQKKGLEKRAEYVRAAELKRKEIIERGQKISMEVSNKSPQLEAAKEKTASLQKLVDEEREARLAIEETARAAREAIEEKEKTSRAQEIMEEQRVLEMRRAVEGGEEGGEGGEIPPQAVEPEPPAPEEEAPTADAEAAGGEDGQHVHDDEHYNHHHDDDHYHDDDYPYPDDYPHGDDEYPPEGYEDYDGEHHPEPEEPGTPAREKSFYELELEEARRIERELEKEHTRLTREQEADNDVLNIDFGHDGAFFALYDKCFQTHIQQYTYELCMFKKALQKEGGSSQNLGTWGEWADDKRVMMYTKGGSCWQGPARTMKVTLLCGEDEFISTVTEPSKCVYEMEFMTPLACSAELAEQAAKELEVMQGK